MTRASAAAWLRQTSTIIGISTIVGLVSAVLGGQMTWAAATGILGAVAAILLPGNAPGGVTVQGAASVVADTVAVQPQAGTVTTVRMQ